MIKQKTDDDSRECQEVGTFCYISLIILYHVSLGQISTIEHFFHGKTHNHKYDRHALKRSHGAYGRKNHTDTSPYLDVVMCIARDG